MENYHKRSLNGFAGIGSNAIQWPGEVVHVEKTEKIAAKNRFINPNHKVITEDIMQYLKENADSFDFIWLSPPCQKHSKMVKATRHKKKQFIDLTLWQCIIFLQHFYKGKWVVENVKPYYEPLIKPTAILGRHCFWSNFNITDFDVKRPKGFINKSTVKGAEELKKWLRINYEGNVYYEGNHCPAQVLRNCVHQDIGMHVYRCSLKSVGEQYVLL